MCLPASNVASDGRQDEEDESAAAAPKTVGASDAIVVVIEGSSGMEDMEDAPGSAPAAEECEQGENPKFYCTGLTPASWAKRGNAIAPGLILFHQEWGTGREMKATQRLQSLPMLAGIKLGTAVLEISIT